MATVFRSLDVEITGSGLKPIYVPFKTIPGLIAGWRPGQSGLTDISGNGHTLTAVGEPVVTELSFIGDMLNGFKTSVPDGLERSILAVYRHPVDVDTVAPASTYGYPVSNLMQQTSTLGTGFGIVGASNVSAALSRCNALVGANVKASTLLSVATGPADPLARRTEFAFIGADTSGANLSAHMYYPKNSDSLQAGVLNTASGTLATRKTGVDFNLLCWEDPSTPAVPYSGMELLEVLFYDHQLTLAEYQAQYAQSKAYAASIGFSI
ncbi:hypothetical protein ABLV11_09800 [Klebsiella sp. GW_Kp181]|uniref:hypothetical protein n=1 Tax=Klebsiella sp. GW_Kp181 TaxID=3153492 RepID=UPI00288E9D27|nr:hypothetical protein [Klebsiella michiganensis]